MGRGQFFVFEGIEGSGKSTQLQLLADLFTAAKLPVRTTREPGGTGLGEVVRHILLSDEYGEIDPRTEALLHTAARAEHVSKLIRPMLKQGTHVLSDRFLDSTLAYQGGGSGLELSGLQSLQRFAVGEIEPDQRILLRASVEEGLRRRFAGGSSLNRIDRAEIEFHQRVAATFEALAKENPARWIVVDGEQSPRRVNELIVAGIINRCPELGLS